MECERRKGKEAYVRDRGEGIFKKREGYERNKRKKAYVGEGGGGNIGTGEGC